MPNRNVSAATRATAGRPNPAYLNICGYGLPAVRAAALLGAGMARARKSYRGEAANKPEWSESRTQPHASAGAAQLLGRV